MRWRGLLAVLLWLGAAACGLPDELRTRAEGLGDRIDREAEALAEEADELDAFLADPEHDFLVPYAEREDWRGSFAAAREEIEHARALWTGEVAPLLEADRSDDEAALRSQLTRLGESLDRAVADAREPARRAAFLEAVREEAPERVAEARAAAAGARGALEAAAAEVERGRRDYPAKDEDLAGRLASLRRDTEETESLAAAAAEELSRGVGQDADLARLGDSAAGAAAGAATVVAADTALRERVAELYRSYSKTLLDMKQESKVEIGRTSWNEAVDFPRETELRYEVAVGPEELDALEAWGDRPIARITSFFGRSSLDVTIDRGLWDALGIDPTLRFPRGDDSAEFWVGDSSARYFHRYRVVEGEESHETDWVEVAEPFFEQHYDDLGMDIVSKPYGLYEDEVLTAAAPPGLAYVGNPKYGQWEETADGRRRWSWGESFLFYYLIFGGPRHYYYDDDWRGWNTGYRGRRAWYGPDDSYGTYGRRTRNSSRYAGGAFGRSGGFRRADRSIRGAGPGGRGGGPGGGGK